MDADRQVGGGGASGAIAHLAAHDTRRYSLRSAASESSQQATYPVRQTGMRLMTQWARGW